MLRRISIWSTKRKSLNKSKAKVRVMYHSLKKKQNMYEQNFSRNKCYGRFILRATVRKRGRARRTSREKKMPNHSPSCE